MSPIMMALLRSVSTSPLGRLRSAGLAVLLLVVGETPATAAERQLVEIASNGWHGAIVVRRDAIPAGLLPELADLPPSPYVEFGWGDREYFPKPDPGFVDALAAGLVPGPAVMHVVALDAPATQAFPKAEVVALTLEPFAFETLMRDVDTDIDRPDGGLAQPVAPGLHPGRSQFYPAHGKFHALNTCNTWTARKLQAAGLDVSPDGVRRAADLMGRLRELPGAAARPAAEE